MIGGSGMQQLEGPVARGLRAEDVKLRGGCGRASARRSGSKEERSELGRGLSKGIQCQNVS